MAYSYSLLILILVVGWFLLKVKSAITSLYFNKLSKFPGPALAGATSTWRAVVECFLNESFCHKLEGIHAKYGEVVRVGPNELHFSNPKAYHDIYNSSNRWDKEHKLYQAFNEDLSSFGYLTYKEAKERKDVLNKLFSQRAISQAQDLVLEKINALCEVLETVAEQGKLVDCNWAFRCLTIDIITYLCFGNSSDAIYEPGFKAPIVVAMDASFPAFALFKHYEWYRNMIMGCPPNISKIISPATAGLVDFQQILQKQIKDLSDNPEQIENLPHNMTIYAHLMNKEAHKSGTVPSAQSLYDEGQTLLFAGSDTVGGTLMVATFHILSNPICYQKLREELLTVWPKLEQVPPLKDLERLPYLNAVIKEALRLTGGAVSGLLRVVPPQGANICDTFVPGGTVVSCGSTFVHMNTGIFPEPSKFSPERWIDNPDLDQWLVPFSRGPRSCLGLNLAWQELWLAVSHIYRRFDLQLDPSSPDKLVFHDSFLPRFLGKHVMAKATPATS